MSIPIFFRDEFDVTHDIEIQVDDTASDVLDKLCAESNFKKARLSIQYEGVLINSSTKLIDLGVVGGSELQLSTGEDWEKVMQEIKDTEKNQLLTVYNDIPFYYKDDEKIIKEILVKISESEIGELFKLFPESVQQDNNIAWQCIRRATGSGVSEIYKLSSEKLKKDEGFLLLALDNCSFDGASDMVLTHPGSSSLANEEVAQIALRRSYEGVAPIFKLLPMEMRCRNHIIGLAFRSTYHVLAPDIFVALPETVRSQISVIKMCLKQCQSNRVPAKVDISPVLRNIPHDMLRDPNVGLQMVKSSHMIYHGDIFKEVDVTPAMKKASNGIVLSTIGEYPTTSIPHLVDFHFENIEIARTLCRGVLDLPKIANTLKLRLPESVLKDGIVSSLVEQFPLFPLY